MKMSGNFNKRILAVDNAVMFLNSMKKYLADTPYTLYCETSGHDALVFLEGNSVDLLLLDVEMPGMSGYELAGRIRQRGINTPIVFVSANAEKEDVAKAEQAGASGILPKPFRASQLIAKIKEFI